MDTETTPVVQYAYDATTGRLTRITYPSGYELDYNYASGLDDTISRLTSLSDNSGTLESYQYLGLDSVIERDHPENGVNLLLTLDRFGGQSDLASHNCCTGGDPRLSDVLLDCVSRPACRCCR